MVERGSGGGVSPCRSSVKGTWREGSLVGDPEGDEASLSVGTLLGNMEGGSFTRNFKGKVNY